MVKPRVRLKPDAIKVHRLREQDVAGGRPIEEVLPDLLRFIGSRPLVGFYLEFDVAMLNKHVRRMLGIGLPNAQIEVSGIYYERKYRDAPPGTEVDLRFMSILRDLGLPALAQHDAYSDALMTAMMYLTLEDYRRRAASASRGRAPGRSRSTAAEPNEKDRAEARSLRLRRRNARSKSPVRKSCGR